MSHWRRHHNYPNMIRRAYLFSTTLNQSVTGRWLGNMQTHNQVPQVVVKSRKDIVEEYSFLINVFRLSGFFPYSKRRRWNLLLEYYCKGLIIGLVILLLSSCYYSVVSSTMIDGMISVYIVILSYNSTIFTHLFLVIYIYATKSTHISIYRDLDQIDREFERHVGHHFDRKLEKKRLLQRFWLCFIFLFLCSVGYFVSCWFTINSLVLVLHALVPGLMNRVFCLMYNNFIAMINYRLEVILKCLEDLERVSDNGIACEHLHPMATLYNITDTTRKIRALRKIYGKLWMISNKMDRCFGLTLMIIILLICCATTTMLYWMLLGFMGYSSEVYLPFPGISKLFTW